MSAPLLRVRASGWWARVLRAGGARNARIDQVLSLMDEIETESRAMTCRCLDCGSTRVGVFNPDGTSAGWLPGTRP